MSLSPRLARKLSCCLQDPPPPRSKAKLLQPNALGPELRCCLQARAGAVFDPGPSAFPGFGLQIRDAFAIPLPVIRVPAAPFSRAVLTDLPVLLIGCQLLLAVFASPQLLTIDFTANGLAGLVLRGLKCLLAIAATPFSHTGRYRIPKKAKYLEADLEYLPRPRPWVRKT